MLCNFRHAEVLNVSEYTVRQTRELRLQRNHFSARMKTKDWPLSYKSEEISCQLSEKKDCVSIRLPDKTKMKKQKQLLLSNI